MRRPFDAAPRLERLEDRTLLAGNVTAQFRGQNAFVSGDAADNGVEILVEGGNVIARGTDGTTINGSTDDFVLAPNATSLSRSLFANLSSGNDTFVVNGLSTGGGIWANGGSGNDLLVVSTANVGRNLNVFGGAGNDDIVIDDSRINGDTRISGFGGDDDIVIRNTVLVDDLSIRGHSGNDVIMLDGIRVGDKTRIAAGSGADNIMVQGTTQFFDRVKAFGGAAADNLEATSEVIFDGIRQRSFSGTTVPSTVIETRITNSETGALAAAEAAIGSSGGEFSITVDNATFSEAAGATAATLTVSRPSGNTDADLEVTLATTPSDQTKISLDQTTVTIPAGQTSAAVSITALDDPVVDSDITVTITASATDFPDASVDVTITNNDSQTLTLTSASTTFNEDTGSATTVGIGTVIDVTVSRDGDTSEDLSVTISTPDTDRLAISSPVVIPAGQSEQSFSVTTIPDIQDTDDIVVTLNATSPGSDSGQLQITLLDNDSPFLDTEFDSISLSENGSSAAGQATFTVTRNTPTTDELIVTLTASDTSRFQAPATLTIPAGSASGSVVVSGIDNSIVDGDQSVAVTASAAGFAQSSANIFVADDDVGELTLTLTSDATVSENAGSGGVTANISRNIQDPAEDLIVSFAVSGDPRITAPATVTIPAGQQLVAVSFDVVDNNVIDATGQMATITASASGFAGSAIDVTVTEDDVATITLTPSVATVAEDAGNGAVTLNVTRNSTSTSEIVALTYNGSALTGPATVSFNVGESEQTVSLNVIDNSSFQENADVTITASSPGRSDVNTTVAVTNDDILGLTTDITSNAFLETQLAVITRANTFHVAGVTEPGATVQIESDNSNGFDDQSAIAGADGSYSFDVPLTHDAVTHGLNTIQVRSVIPSEGVDAISDPILVHMAIGTVVRMNINQDLNQDGTNEFFDVELLDTDAPITVANFLSYVNDGSYDNMFAHRSPPAFVVQGGGFRVNNQVVSPVVAKPPIQNEFLAANSNVTGTLSMALSGTPDSGSSGWFFNTVDNSGLDANQHTVFGRVIAGGQNVISAINLISTIDLRLITGQQGLLQNTPLARSPLTSLTGTSALTADSNVIIGTGTQFTTELQVGDIIVDPFDQQLIVTSIVSDTELTVDLEANANDNGVPFSLLSLPQDDDYVIFTDIGEILDQI